MKLWILLAVALLLLVFALWSEPFTANSTIRAPPYSDGETRRIFEMLPEESQDTLLAKARADNPTLKEASLVQKKKMKSIAGQYVSGAVGEFFTRVYTPKTTTLTTADVDEFMASRTSNIKDPERDAIVAYFIKQAGPQSSGYSDIMAAMGQTPPAAATGPTGPAAPAAPAAPAPAGGPTGPTATGPTGPMGGATGPAPGFTGAFQGTWTTTGGSTSGSGRTFTAGPTQGLLGPAFTSFGDPSPSGNTLDSSKYTSYPQVLGGVSGKSATVVPGAGVISGTKTLELPSMDSLGASAAAQFFPFSRTPGDMEKIPDPYRVSQMFNTASYSSKTDPVPFLTDFSTFQR